MLTAGPYLPRITTLCARCCWLLTLCTRFGSPLSLASTCRTHPMPHSQSRRGAPFQRQGRHRAHHLRRHLCRDAGAHEAGDAACAGKHSCCSPPLHRPPAPSNEQRHLDRAVGKHAKQLRRSTIDGANMLRRCRRRPPRTLRPAQGSSASCRSSSSFRPTKNFFRSSPAVWTVSARVASARALTHLPAVGSTIADTATQCASGVDSTCLVLRGTRHDARLMNSVAFALLGNSAIDCGRFMVGWSVHAPWCSCDLLTRLLPLPRSHHQQPRSALGKRPAGKGLA